ncbi:4Fe-4S binding protein [Suipraeoptans intestinalis]|uniref:4Fe-4S binding protein n=1 Tax=Suipraeoptans intestinalis TaxID=2606628 RepID=UPI0023F00769|nr:4Fe-4S binding protein [Suipraeoptans intestinalis]MDD7769473.1 4Fe-4S binding protein [Suipraeoptans intestinalis]MDY3121885.1 4Fe-4S binding protein [Suipraeoptans intestinalis]
MNAQDCLAMLREMKDVAFATVDEKGNPQVRIIDVMLVEKEKLYFCTGRGKEFYNQLRRKPEVAITGLNKEFQMVRLSGKAKKLPEQKYWIDRIFEENPVMNGVYPGESRYILEPFCIDSGDLEFFDLGKSPIYRENFVFGKAKGAAAGGERENGKETAKESESGNDEKKGFWITEACIGCGKCMRVCPQQCITKGTPYLIRQENCLHCGLCFESCPGQAIVRRGE